MTLGLHNLKADTRRPKRKRVGRGIGSRGAKSGRGMKGQKARAGYSRRAGFEGGQTALYQRLPKARGAKQAFNPRPTRITAVAVHQLGKFNQGEIVGVGKMIEAGLADRRTEGVKLIGGGEISHALTMRVQAATKAARAAIEKKGGKIELVENT